MSRDHTPGYSHTQVGWWLIVTLGIVCVAVLAIFSLAGVGPRSLPPTYARVIGWAVLGTLVITVVLLTTLTVRVTNDRVDWHFGPGVVHFSLPLAEIAAVVVTQTPLWAGIGIHWILTGWVYNVSGRDAVVLTKRDGSKAWLGTDEPERLAAAIERARAATRPPDGEASGTRTR